MRILSYNIHKGFAPDRVFTLRAMREAFARIHPDLILLQEVQGEHRGHARDVDGWPTAAQCEFLADTLWPHHAYGCNAVYDAGHHGNAVLSKWPILSWSNLDLSTNRFERRGLLHVEIAPPTLEYPLHVLCCHLDLLHRGRRAQVDRIVARIQEAVPGACPLVLAGDFNDWSERLSLELEDRLGLTEVHRAIHGRVARSYPAWLPVLPLDRMYARGLAATDARVLTAPPWNRLSDHAALLGEFRAG